jgi:hypothetical protein
MFKSSLPLRSFSRRELVSFLYAPSLSGGWTRSQPVTSQRPLPYILMLSSFYRLPAMASTANASSWCVGALFLFLAVGPRGVRANLCCVAGECTCSDDVCASNVDVAIYTASLADCQAYLGTSQGTRVCFSFQTEAIAFPLVSHLQSTVSRMTHGLLGFGRFQRPEEKQFYEGGKVSIQSRRDIVFSKPFQRKLDAIERLLVLGTLASLNRPPMLVQKQPKHV